ncbi:MAG TPA: TIGR03557 family F420-dependent LLM class oxidoreductase [Streptosporangiaceae bacterium]
MTQFGYTAMGEQIPAKQLVTDLVAAEMAGFDFSVMSDHYFPWIEEQGHSPNAWAVLGAAAQATQRLPLMTFVTCPTFRYHPAVVAQQAATIGVLSSGRFTLGLGSGENLNEHVVGGGWPSARVRQERLAEAVEIIRELFTGDYVSYQGRHFEVERAKLYDLPDQPPPVAIAVSGSSSVSLATTHADAMISVEPAGDLVQQFNDGGGEAKPKYGQLAVCYGADEKAAKRQARELWRWALPGWHVMAELPEPRSFDAASQNVTEDDIAELVPCGPETGRYVDAVKQYTNAGFTHVALVQVGAENQQEFIEWAAGDLLPTLRENR